MAENLHLRGERPDGVRGRVHGRIQGMVGPPAAGRSKAVERIVDMLGLKGVGLRYPRTSDVLGSRHSHMRELRVGTHPPIRIFYAFDPRPTAILLLGGHKRHGERFYRDYVARADAIYVTSARDPTGKHSRSATAHGGAANTAGHHSGKSDEERTRRRSATVSGLRHRRCWRRMTGAAAVQTEGQPPSRTTVQARIRMPPQEHELPARAPVARKSS